MEANNFIAKIKANGTDQDECNLTKVYDEYKMILSNLAAKDKSPFSLNVLCTICRNIDKVPSWRDKVDTKAMLTLSIDCVRETRTSPKQDQVKTLACIYHIHKHVVKLNASPPPELVLKLSYMPFENDASTLLEEYCKTYWNIVADRMSYMEKLKPKNSISKLLPRLIDDIIKVINIYDTVQFCTNILTFSVKKLYYLYSDCNAKYFNEIFKVIQTKMKKDSVDKLKEKEMVDLYVKFNDCFYVLAESCSKNRFKDCNLDVAVSTAVAMLGHSEDIKTCLDTFYVNGFCKIFMSINDPANIENVLKMVLTSCIDLEKNNQIKVLRLTCPYLSQFVRLFIEYCVANEKHWKDNFSTKTQYNCLNLMYYLSTKKGEQLLKCDNCKAKTSLHDSLRLLFLIKHIPSLSISQNLDLTPILPTYLKLVTMQHKILQELRVLGCANHEKCFRKLQTDVHNTAIILNKANYYEYSIKLFNMYVEYEIKYFKNETDFKNICRALYNKSICELDFKLYDEAIKDAFLSLVFSLPDGLSTEKYMSLVMDIKAKELKAGDDDSDHDEFQLISIVEACKVVLEEKKYGNLKPFLCHLKFSDLLKHEFSMYAKLWPSIVPIAGVWRSFRDMLNNSHVSWAKAENEDDILCALYEVVLETPTVVRTIHSEYYAEIVTELLERFANTSANTTELKFIHASLLFLKAEYDLAEASQKYGWKITEPSMDPDQVPSVRTLPQEHSAIQKALEALDLLSEAYKDIGTVSPSKQLNNSLQLYQVWVVQFLHLCRPMQGLQLAYICLHVATHVSDEESYIRAANAIISLAVTTSEEISNIISRAVKMCNNLGDSNSDVLVFLCSVAIYYNKCGSPGVAARLLGLVQAKILESYEKNPDIKLDLAVGRLMEAQNEICRASLGGTLSAVSNTQRHYLAVANTATKWTHRRFTSLTLKHSITLSSVRCVSVCRCLALRRRARCAAACSLPAAAAQRHAILYAMITSTHCVHDAQTKIDNRLKHILGLQPSNETQEHKSDPQAKTELLTPRLEQLETMLENVVFKKTQSSPSLPCTSVFAYKMPEFFRHTRCNCYACDNPYVFVLSCLTSGLEASTYFRAKEMDIARNYFEGTLKSFGYADANLKAYFKNCRSKFEGFVVDIVERDVYDEFRSVQIEVLIEAAFFELAQGLYEKADDFIVRIHDLMQDFQDLNAYLKNEVYNLISTACRLRKVVKKPTETGLEAEMESLKLNTEEEPKTPVAKPKNPPKMTKIVVKNEELPNVKRKVIKLNLDDVSEEQPITKNTRKRAVFKIPVPVTTKPVIESITPRTKSKPDILVTKPPEDVKETPKGEKSEFFTPNSTPADQFFTPMTSMKTYSKKSLRNNIVKNLEAEFSTPKCDKENSTVKTDVERLELPKPRATRAKVDKKTLKRATSPGKLVKEVKPTRSRLRNPSNFNVHEDK